MEEKEFKNSYISTFVATWTAINYEDYCIRNMHSELENPPFEDAEYLADKAWENYSKLKKDKI